uniref:Uncharacterized protein n=1 Tax=Anguilla anguilla TaxID=7936 RepID=A0A0E9WCY8_ANGAN
MLMNKLNFVSCTVQPFNAYTAYIVEKNLRSWQVFVVKSISLI